MNCIKSNQIPSRLQGPLLFGEGRPLAWAGCRLCPPHWQPSWPVPFTAAGDTWEKHGFARRLHHGWSLFWAKRKRFRLQSYFSPSVTTSDMKR